MVGVWISSDGHYAFVDFKTAEDATQAFALQQVSIHGQYLKVGRPKNATGIIPTPAQLLCGNPNAMVVNHRPPVPGAIKKSAIGKRKYSIYPYLA